MLRSRTVISNRGGRCREALFSPGEGPARMVVDKRKESWVLGHLESQTLDAPRDDTDRIPQDARSLKSADQNRPATRIDSGAGIAGHPNKEKYRK